MHVLLGAEEMRLQQEIRQKGNNETPGGITVRKRAQRARSSALCEVKL